MPTHRKTTTPSSAFPDRYFSSEAVFQQAIAKLLNRMPDISGVQIIQGSQELGKDLIFYIKGAFGEKLLCACVVKNTKISGQVDNATGARTVFFQAQQAFDSAHTDDLGKEVRVERVYVVTPYNLSPATILSIKGKLQERAGQVVFIGGARLFDLFKEFWPGYLADESESIQAYLEATKTNFEAENPMPGVGALYNLGEIDNYSKAIYVQPIIRRDVYAYELGPFLADKLDTDARLNHTMRRDAVETLTSNTKKLTSAIQFLAEWELCSPEHKDQLLFLAESFISSLSQGWKRGSRDTSQDRPNTPGEQGLLHGFEESQQEALDIKPDLSAAEEALQGGKIRHRVFSEQRLLHDFDNIADALATLEKCKQGALINIKRDLSAARKTVQGAKLQGIQTLSDPAYLQACSLDDCARSAPEGIFLRKIELRINFPKSILDSWMGPLLIVGAPGFGKTSFCKWHALLDAERLNTGKSTTLPVYVPLYRLSREPLGTFEETFLKTLGKSALIGHNGSEDVQTIRVYLDGLDEIASQERRREIIDLAAQKMETSTRYQIILTSRDYIYSKWLDVFPRVALGGLEQASIEELVGKWLHQNPESHKRFWEQIDKMPALKSLMQIPLLATLIILVFRQTGQLPESRPRLYEIFVDLLSGGWDLAKGVLRQSRFGQRIKTMILSELAANLQERRRREFYAQDIKAIVGATLSKGIRPEWEEIQRELLIDGLITRNGAVMQFSHHSFQEYLTARSFQGSPNPFRTSRALDSYICGDDWWKEVMMFYIGLSTNPTELSRWIGREIHEITSCHGSHLQVQQIKDLRTAVADAFPNLSHVSLEDIRYPGVAPQVETD